MHSLAVFAIALFATCLSVMSGGGASTITIPMYISLGLPYPLAIATQQVCSVFWVLPASRNYLKGKKIDWKFLGFFTALGLIGVLAGVTAALSINQRTFQIVIGTLILILVAYTYFKRDLGLHEVRPVSSKRNLAYLVAPLMGFNEAVFGGGNGIVFSLTTMKTRGFDFLDALGYYFAIAFVWVLVGLFAYVSKGFYDLSIMAPAVVGSLIGGYAGSRFAKAKGNRFVKIMFILVGGVLGLKMLLGW